MLILIVTVILDNLSMLGSALYWKLVFTRFTERLCAVGLRPVSSKSQQKACNRQPDILKVEVSGVNIWGLGPTSMIFDAKFASTFYRTPPWPQLSLQPVEMDLLPKSNRTKASPRCLLQLTHNYSVAKVTKSGLLKIGTENYRDVLSIRIFA